ncbi:WecB/TagA/CpsF family glycosyltransferase [Prosthecochloris sp. GSB1]|uniref:WecB/TagA/CpsF family glycosyltransferase n=1 Tax=Prosthecochloris sp. GSB1 TaxID=281093 RepID=UPI00142D1EBF|nr:WecB/TagA/CpsF family glycosyltransferase [Prosthecochloris sp. GSB1]
MDTTGRFYVGSVGVSLTNPGHALQTVEAALKDGVFGYLCHMDTRTAYLAVHDREYADVQNGSFMTFPDGMPLVWLARLRGHDGVGKVSGKDLMDAVFSVSVEKGYTHYFYGSTQETIANIRKNLVETYPGLVILDAVSPPFQPLEDFDIDALAAEVNRLRPVFFWCGLGAPKQEKLMALLQPKLDATFCSGVGLAFEYFAGTVRRAPEWMQRSGLEWVYRLAQQPRNIGRVARPFAWVMKELVLASMGKKSNCFNCILFELYSFMVVVRGKAGEPPPFLLLAFMFKSCYP